MKLKNLDNCCKGKRISELCEKQDLSGLEFLIYQENSCNGKISVKTLIKYLQDVLQQYVDCNFKNSGHIKSEPAFKLLGTLPEMIADRACKDEFGNNINDTYITRDTVTTFIKSVFKDFFVDFMPTIFDGSITEDMLSETVLARIDAAGGGTITNFPDGEDLTAIESKLKFKDKEFDPNNYSGYGRIMLRKNMANGINVLTQSMMSKPNTIYVIQYDFDLRGATITIPTNSILWFWGGSLNNGKLVGQEGDITIIWGEITGDVQVDINISNMQWIPADEEDITSRPGKFKFKDKDYDETNFSGLGRKFLRKYIVMTPSEEEGVDPTVQNILSQTEISEANTRYIIQYDYDLNGETITIPENCVLDFQGGKFSNGTVVLTDTAIFPGGVLSDYLDVTLEGTYALGQLKYDETEGTQEWIGTEWRTLYGGSSSVDDETVNNINTQITEIQGDITEIQGDITDIRGDITTIEGNVTNLTNRVTNLESSVTSIQESITQINSTISDIQEQISQIWDAIEDLQDGSGGSTGGSGDSQYWQLDSSNKLYTTYDVYSTGEVSAYGSN